jgi:hypothetical protein
MYPRSKFQEILLAIREEMAREADFDVDLFVEMVRSGNRRDSAMKYSIGDPAKAEPAPKPGRSKRPRSR